MKKKLLLSGTIIGTICSAIYTLILLIAIVQVFSILGSYAAEVAGPMLLIILQWLVFVVDLILNAVSINAWNNEEKFKKKKATIITAIVFNFICAIIAIFSINGEASTASIVFSIIILIGLIVASILDIIDLSTKKDVKQVTENTENEDKGISEKIEKLNKLKEEDKITEEEYNSMKEDAIKNELNK